MSETRLTPERLNALKRWSRHGNGGRPLPEALAEVDRLTARWEALKAKLESALQADSDPGETTESEVAHWKAGISVAFDAVCRLEQEP